LRPTVLSVALATAMSSSVVGETPAYTHTLRSDRVDGTHTEFATDLAPVTLGLMTIQLRPTHQRLEVIEHELALGPVDAGLDAARIRARFEGEADLVAELDVAGVVSEIEDHIVLPQQELEVAGVVEMRRQGDEIVVTTVENPDSVTVEIESDLAGKLQILCRGLAVMAMGNLDCDGLGEQLSVLSVPLPEPGREFSVALSDLTAEERRQIEAYLGER